MMTIAPADFDDPQILALLRLHLAHMHASSPPGTVFALDLSGLRAPDISVFAAWQDAALMGFGALKQLAPDHGELKSFRTHPDHLRKGVAARLLDHVIAEARSRGFRRLSLETGSGPEFEPALALYRRRGFAAGAPFCDYVVSDFNQFLHLDLD